jgi:DNA-binding NtrC family response regulator
MSTMEGHTLMSLSGNTRSISLDIMPPGEAVRVHVVEGPDQGREMILSRGHVTIGTSPDCDFQLTDTTVSARHATLELSSMSLIVKDLGSKNGVRYLGARVNEANLPVGSAVQLGRSWVAVLPPEMPPELSDRSEMHGLVGKSVAMRRLFAQLERIAPSEAPALILGETGAGKEAVARALHLQSRRSSARFEVFECAGLQESQSHALLFGSTANALPGVTEEEVGALERADGGTLFLDQVDELPLALQPALLKALDTRRYQRMGDTVTRRSNFRVVAATHADLERAVEDGRFRRDLYYRLSGVILRLPPLRERPEDVPVLAEHLANRSAGQPVTLPSAFMAFLRLQRWPGNVRELQNAVERFLTLGSADGTEGQAKLENPNFFHARDEALRSFEREYLLTLLDRHEQVVTEAAKEAGISRRYFYKLLDAHELTPRRRA